MTSWPRGPSSSMSRPEAYLIGLTGNIATGKSSVAAALADLGARVIDADAVAHQVMRAQTPTWQGIVEAFGPEIVGEDGEIDRKRLGAIVFADPAALRRLEQIVHPAVIAEVDRRIAEIAAQAAAQGQPRPVIVIEAIKLIESGMNARYDALWVVTCAAAEQMKRLMARSGLTAEEAQVRIAAQPPASAKVALADVVIDNSGTWAQTREQVRQAWADIPGPPRRIWTKTPDSGTL